MLSENIYVNEDGLNIPVVTKKSWAFTWKCPKCNSTYLITKDNLEDSFLNSDPHDPLQDYIFCPNCEYNKGLFEGVDVVSNGITSKLHSDGSYVYLSRLGIEERIL